TAGLLTAGFADRFDRKKLLLFFYIGFIAGTILCGIATSYYLLVGARIITGLFGGVIGSISMAIITDLFGLQQRGRVMGFVQMGFGASQILGIPVGLYFANAWGWHAPFIMVALLAIVIAVFIGIKLQPLTRHLAIQHDKTAITHLWHTIVKKDYRIGFTSSALLSIGGFMMMPFGTAFAINNLKITQEQLPVLFMIAGLSTLVIMPMVGRLSDRVDKFKIFVVGACWMIVTVVLYTNLSVTPFWLVMIFNILMMAGIMGRMIPSQALTSAIPEMEDRGAFMSINASIQQFSGGIAAICGGLIVVQKDKFSPLEHYNTLGYVIVVISIISMVLMYRVSQMVKRKQRAKTEQNGHAPVEDEVIVASEV
ncbi:MAG TPA: MFS transporter, partial [Bacteroidia bacterium]|nr:MFS transporter [Bacteroidia bacterium]